ncbi:hypothetical protein ABT158_22690 [Nonomuraea sp. NPDC001636]|uniref:hypothetical protein n=1 Tax=Nonomuraea sp. NPDC001636 TaxID=3154391 RepID=UPI00331FE103
MSTIVRTIAAGAGQFVIEEIRTDPRGAHLYYTEAAALDLAAAQHRPVTLIRLDGTHERLAITFDPDAFERHAYRGHIAYGLSMTDGHYAPEPFERWVTTFRRHPNWRGIDAPWPIVDALDTYKTHLAAAPAA